MQIVFDPSRNALVHATSSETSARCRLFVLTKTFAFLLATQQGASSQPTDESTDAGQGVEHNPLLSIVPLFIRRHVSEQKYSFVDPLSRLYLCAEPIGTGLTHGNLVVDRNAAGLWEQFTLERSSDVTDAEYEAQRLLLALHDSCRSAGLVRNRLEMVLKETPPRYVLAYLRMMPGALGWLPEAFDRTPRAADRIAGDTDIYAVHALNRLLEWRSNRRPGPASRSLDPSTDQIFHLEFSPKIPTRINADAWVQSRPMYEPSPAKVSNVFIRQSVLPRKRACVLTCARNEGAYLLEWVAYHLSIGFDEIFIYSNNNDDASDGLLRALADARIITHLDNPVGAGVSPQLKAYAHALSLLPEILDFEWTLFTDVDEFIVLDKDRFAGIGDFLDLHDILPTDAITMNWLMYGMFNELDYVAGRFVAERFSKRFVGVNPHIKTLFKPRYFSSAHPHYPHAGLGQRVQFRDSEGAPHTYHHEFSLSARPLDTAAWINHYWTKSLVELMVKFSRNSGNEALQSRSDAEIISKIETLVLRGEHNVVPVEDDRIRHFLPGARRVYEDLRSIPAIGRCEAIVNERFAQKIEALRSRLIAKAGELDAPLFQALFRVPAQLDGLG